MSASICCGLQAKRPEDIRQLKEVSIQLTREWSMKSLGYDITIRDEERDQYTGSHVEDDGVTWNYFDGSGLHEIRAEIEELIQKWRTIFPIWDCKSEFAWKALACMRAFLKMDSGWRSSKYTLDVYVKQDTDFRILVGLVADSAFRNRYNVKNVKLYEQEHFALLTFEKNAGPGTGIEFQ